MQWRNWLHALARLAAAESAAVAVWAFSVNRVIIHWVDSPVKILSEAALGAGLGALAGIWAFYRRWPHRLWMPLAVLGLFGLGEVRRAALRDAYGASLYSASPSRLLDPVSTTNLAVRHFSVTRPLLGSRRFRVVHLTDLHISEKLPYSYFERVTALVREQNADAVVLTGDYLSHVGRLELFARWLDDLSRSPGTKYAVLGNHDYWAGAPDDVRAALRAAGVHVLSGVCEIDGGTSGISVLICGTEAPWGPDLSPASSAHPADLRLTLSHTPDNVYDLRDLGSDAVFTGHTHGGQIRILGLGAVVVPSRFGRRFDEGHFDVDGTHLFVSAGIGADAPALRIWCPPEIFVVDFVGANPDAIGPS